MAEEVAKLKATVEIDTSKSEAQVKKLDGSLDKLEKTIRKVDTANNRQALNQQKLAQALERSKQATTKSVIEEEKLNRARENTRKATAQAEQAELRLAKSKENTTKKNNSLTNSIMTAITKTWVYTKAIAGLTSGLTSAGREALNFQKNMSLSNTILDISKEKLNTLSTEVSKMGKDLGKAPSEMAMGLYDVASSTDETVDRMFVLEKATKASVAGFTDVSTAVDAGIGMMNAFGLEVTDLDRIYDLQFKTVDRGIIKYGELKEALGNMMSSAVNAKVPMEEMLGQLAFLTKSGQNYAKSSVALARTYDTIFEKSEKLKKILNVDVADSKGNLRKTTDILGDMAKELAKFDEMSQVNILEEIGFSDRSSRAIIALMGNVEGVRKEIELVSSGVGSMEQAFIKASDNILTDWQKMKSGIASTFSELITENEKFIRSMINGLGNFTNVLITGVRNWAYLFRGLKENIKDTFDENLVGAKFTVFSAQNKKWLSENEDFVKKSKTLMEEDLSNAEDTAERYKALYEHRLRVLNEYNRKTIEAVEKTANEKIRLENLAMGNVKSTGKTETMLPEKPKQFSMLRKEDYSLISESLASGKLDTSKLKGGLSEIDKVIKAKPTKDQAKKVETAKKQYEQYVKEVTKAFELTLATGGSLVDMSKKFFTSALASNDLKKINSVTANSVTVEEELDSYESDKKGKKPYDFIKQNEKNLKELQALHLSDEEYWKQRENFLQSAIKNMVEDNQNTGIAENLLDKARLNLEDIKINETLETLGTELANKTLEDYNALTEKWAKEANRKLQDTQTFTSEGGNQAIADFENDFQSMLNGDLPLIEGEESLNDVIKRYEKYNEKLSASSELLGELSDVMKNDFLGALANSINGINSVVGLVGQMKTNQIGGLAGGLGIATAVIGVLSPIVSTWFNDDDQTNKQEEATNKFNDAVETFKQTVEDMNLSQRVSFANLKMPTNLQAGGVSGGGTSTGILDVMAGWGIPSIISQAFGGGAISWGANNASIDTSGIKNQLTGAGYGDIAKQVDAIFGKFAQYTSYIDARDWLKKKSYVSGYDTTGAMAEINKLIKEAYDLNLKKFKEALNLTSDAFVGAIEGAMKEGKSFSITDMVTDSFNKVYADLIGRAGGDLLGSQITDVIMQQMATMGISKESFAGMTSQQIVAKINELMKNAPVELQKIFDKLGISAEKVNEQFDKIGNRNMPSLLKIGVAEVLASNTYNNSNTVVVQNAYGTVDRRFIDLTNKAVGSNMYSRTGN